VVEETDEEDVARWIRERCLCLGVGAVPVGGGSVRRFQEFTDSTHPGTDPGACSNASTNPGAGTYAGARTSTGTHAARTCTSPDLHGNL
jgi:hypothetical protein